MPACGPVQPDTWRILPQLLYAVLAPQMVLAANGLHPNFTGMSLLSWNVHNPDPAPETLYEGLERTRAILCHQPTAGGDAAIRTDAKAQTSFTRSANTWVTGHTAHSTVQ